MFREPADVGDTNAELVFAVIGSLSKDLGGADLTRGVVGLDNEVGQSLPVDAEVPLADLTAGIHHIHAFSLLLRVVVFVLDKGIDHREAPVATADGPEIDTHLGIVGDGALGDRCQTAIA